MRYGSQVSTMGARGESLTSRASCSRCSALLQIVKGIIPKGFLPGSVLACQPANDWTEKGHYDDW